MPENHYLQNRQVPVQNVIKRCL